jgi:hypothetical protein
MKHGVKSADDNPVATLSNRSSEGRDWDESDERDIDNAIEVRAETPDAPR